MKHQFLLFLVTLDNWFDHLIDYFFDRKFHLDTLTKVNFSQRLIEVPNRINAKQYQGTRWRVFNRIMKNLPIQYRDYNFIDTGSGKGKALILASGFNFKAIKGIELFKPLYDISCQNLRKMNLNHRIQIEHGDVLNFTPPKGPNLYYLYNPFNENVLKDFFTNLKKNQTLGSRDVIIYLNPRYHSTLTKLGFQYQVLLNNLNYNKVVLIYTM
ncbi:MAG: hypothetical protein A2381_06625 [Bdellovibrionales bacterium RIFOXYB1_FULL_37_110]|nr:MAG: hypothetical protein A2181_08645 [Bdellovibrionales bacterium RIFOXYA1_FULL_38_20]OFZ50216.1 MAG: hypothetical protein A2417_19475 [Bdellovibrionales bacterium RIFOXYC1_FULL_37_79]OFZ57653.1 MAG: hypothetical protein A2381_06625 [Bdellovibrionales bacterium RIFOXYB1_FULL_37_110]OFZ61420.1 MAG: hypothetical protein A2577_00990 [Bdellovibrionales bacterium RIFOXYD1_FULL_36_51]OFZ66695.1 MAG: hypothetical protein A2328_10850 [Bdellovibrionales bacterium RIFOXYB2_FULL_36_6]